MSPERAPGLVAWVARVAVACLAVVVPGCLDQPGAMLYDEASEGVSTLELGNTTLEVTLRVSDGKLAPGERATLAANLSNVGGDTFHWTNAGCPGEVFWFYVHNGERFPVVPDREPRVWECALQDMSLAPGEWIAWSEEWSGRVSEGMDTLRMKPGAYMVSAVLNGDDAVFTSAPITVV